MRASLACRLPQCRCSSPALLRTNTSHRGQSAESMMSADALIAAESMTSADPAAVAGAAAGAAAEGGGGGGGGEGGGGGVGAPPGGGAGGGGGGGGRGGRGGGGGHGVSRWAGAGECLVAWARAAARTQAPSSQAWTRAPRRSWLQGPSPEITRQNSLQSIAPWSCCWRCGFQRRSGSGSVTPSTRACATVASMNCWRRRSLETRLMPQRIDCAEWGDCSSGGPNIISDGHHQRSTASCTIARCASLPWRIMVSSAS